MLRRSAQSLAALVLAAFLVVVASLVVALPAHARPSGDFRSSRRGAAGIPSAQAWAGPDETVGTAPPPGDAADRAIPGTTRSAASDTMRSAAPDTTLAASPDSAGARARPPGNWRDARLPLAPRLASRSAVLTRGRVDRSPEETLREVLEWALPLRRISGPSRHAPDPIDWGDLPGREPVSTVVEGFPCVPWGNPDPPPEPVTPLWLESAALAAPDPILLPSNPSGGPILFADLVRPDSLRAESAVRLTMGTNRTYSEELIFARPGGPGLFRFGYGDSKTDGRFLSGYFQQFEENLCLRYDRGTSWGGWRVGWQQGETRIRPDFSRRYLHDRDAWDTGLRARVRGWSADLSAGVSWERLAYEGEPPAKRKEALARALLRLEGPGARVRPLVTLEWERQRRRFYRPDSAGFSEDRTSDGPGLAFGIEGASGARRYRGSAGWTRVTPHRSDWSAAAAFEGPVLRGWRWSVHADRTPRAALVPRLAGDLSTAVGQGVWVASPASGVGEAIVDPRRRPEVFRRIELALRHGGGDPGDPAGEDVLEARARWVELRHAIVPGEGELPNLRPDRYDLLSAGATDGDLRVAALHLAGARSLPGGLRLEVRGAVRAAAPDWKTQPWMTPFDGRGRLAWRRRLFREDLDLEAWVRADWSGRRATAAGTLPASDRYDAGITGSVESLTLFLVLLNLESDETAAADLILPEEVWTPLPLRSYRAGLTWRFLD